MTDLIARLRDADTTRRIGESYADTHERRQRDRDDAADEIERLRAALRPFACTCEAKHQADCSRSEVDCPFWNARAALDYRKMEERT